MTIFKTGVILTFLVVILAVAPLFHAYATTADDYKTSDSPDASELTSRGSILEFYQGITTEAYLKTFDDKLWPENFVNARTLEKILVTHQGFYIDNLVNAADHYFRDTGQADREALYYWLTAYPYRKGQANRNLMSAFIYDQAGYEKGRPTPMNPLFTAIHTLGNEGKISEEQAKAYIKGMHIVVTDYKPEHGLILAFNMQKFHNAMVERLDKYFEKEPEPEEEAQKKPKAKPKPALNWNIQVR